VKILMKCRDDGLYKKVKEPDVVVGAHVMPERAGVIGTKRGLIASSADRFQCVEHFSAFPFSRRFKVDLT
jgi:metal-dependent amidase/aminoacylase/carboxypeptidase family protein